MIPKNLIFIWLGQTPPIYTDQCIKTFHEVNPDFNVMFIHEPNPKNPKNQDFIDCIKLVNSNTYNIYKHMVERPFAQQYLKATLVKQFTALSDAFRLFLLNRYGGVYLDLDAFPVRPFDEHLMSKSNGFTINYAKRWYDFFFMGFDKNCVDNNLIRCSTEAAHNTNTNSIFDANLVYKIKINERIVNELLYRKRSLVEKFKQGKLQFGDSLMNPNFYPDYYIDHYKMRTWEK